LPQVGYRSAFRLTEHKEGGLPDTVCLASEADCFIVCFQGVKEFLAFGGSVGFHIVRDFDCILIFVLGSDF
jgi:hypothetical protein